MSEHDDDEADEREKPEAEIYNDTHIAPKLLALAKECEANGIGFVAHTSWADKGLPDGENGETTALGNTKASASFAIAFAAARAAGNLDKFIMTLLRWHDAGDTDISRTMLGSWTNRTAPSSSEPVK